MGKAQIKEESFSLKDTTLATRYFEKGDSLKKAYQYDSSNFYFEKAKGIYKDLSTQYNKENIWAGVVRCSNKISRNLLAQGEYKASLNLIKQVLKYGENKLKNSAEIAQSYQEGGNVFWYLGNYDAALDMYQKSLSIMLKLVGEEHNKIAGSYNGIGLIYSFKGDYDKALEYFQKSLSIRLRLFGEDHPDVSVSYFNLGHLFLDRNDLDKALSMLQKSLSIRLKLKGEDYPRLASNYDALGDVFYNKGDYDKALEMFHKSLSLRDRILEKGHHAFAISCMKIGFVYSAKENYDSALESHKKSLSIRIQSFGEKHPLVAEVYQNIADVYEKKNNFDSALTYSQKSIISLVASFNDTSVYANPSLDGISSEPYLLNSLKTKATLFTLIAGQSDVTKLNNALSTFEIADDLIDKMRLGYKSEGSKFLLGEKASEVYESAIETCLRLYKITKEELYKQQAFLFIEKSKAAVLQQELSESRAKEFAKIPKHLLNEEKQLRIDLAIYDTQLKKQYQKKKNPDSIKIGKYQNLFFDLRNQYEQLISDFENNYPDYYELKYQTETSSVKEIQNQISPGSCLLNYFIGNDILHIFMISKENFDIVSIKKPDNFQTLVHDFYSSIIKSESQRYISSAEKLSELLITPVIQKIEFKRKLIVIPHNLTYKIPFEALLTETNIHSQEKPVEFSRLGYLIKKYDISYHYSATLYLKSLTERKKILADNTNNAAVNIQQNIFIGFAPVFPEDDLTGYTISAGDNDFLSANDLRSIIDDRKKFNELEYSEWEVKSIVELFAKKVKGKNSKAYFYSDATEEIFKKDVNNFKIVHIATHSFINEIRPDISGIVFAQPADTSVLEDGILYSGETYNLDMNADLVVLSSCESGIGKLIRGEGMMALTRGFLYSGADNLIFSLWKIPDKHTSELMIEFYNQMLSGKNYANALREAKLKLIENSITARPRSWASFVLVGRN